MLSALAFARSPSKATVACRDRSVAADENHAALLDDSTASKRHTHRQRNAEARALRTDLVRRAERAIPQQLARLQIDYRELAVRRLMTRNASSCDKNATVVALYGVPASASLTRMPSLICSRADRVLAGDYP